MKDPIKDLLGGDVWGVGWMTKTGAHFEDRELQCYVCQKKFPYKAVIYPSGDEETEAQPDGYWVPDYATNQWVWICNSCHAKPSVQTFLKEMQHGRGYLDKPYDTVDYGNCDTCHISVVEHTLREGEAFDKTHKGHKAFHWYKAKYPIP